MSQTNTGTNKNLINVTRFGIVSQSLPTVSPASSFGSGFTGRFMSTSLWGLPIYQQRPTGVAADAKALQRELPKRQVRSGAANDLLRIRHHHQLIRQRARQSDVAPMPMCRFQHYLG